MGEMELSFNRLKNITRLKLNHVVDRWETGRWRDDLDSKTTLQVYRNKVDIRCISRNVFGSVFIDLYRAPPATHNNI